MSSLAAVQADGYYIDPNKFNHKKRGRDSVNAIAHSNPLGARAKRLKSEGILVVRFEMPHNVWCSGCERHIARGVRFNADKKASGKYLSTTIWEFSMRCPSCPNIFKIKTDPKNADYEMIEGCRKQSTSGSDHITGIDDGDDVDADDEALELLMSNDEVQSMTITQRRERKKQDPMFKLECETEDRLIAARDNERLIAIADAQESRYGADRLLANGAARRIIRESIKESSVRALEGAALGLEGIELLPATEQDYKMASDIMKNKKNLLLIHDIPPPQSEINNQEDEVNEDKEEEGNPQFQEGGIKRSLSESASSKILLSSIFPSALISNGKKSHLSLLSSRPQQQQFLPSSSSRLQSQSLSHHYSKNRHQANLTSKHSSNSSIVSAAPSAISTRRATSIPSFAQTRSVSSIVRDGLMKARQEKNAIAKRVENIARFGGGGR
jgi:coiled-coil domain-containing protein 130